MVALLPFVLANCPRYYRQGFNAAERIKFGSQFWKAGMKIIVDDRVSKMDFCGFAMKVMAEGEGAALANAEKPEEDAVSSNHVERGSAV